MRQNSMKWNCLGGKLRRKTGSSVWDAMPPSFTSILYFAVPLCSLYCLYLHSFTCVFSILYFAVLQYWLYLFSFTWVLILYFAVPLMILLCLPPILCFYFCTVASKSLYSSSSGMWMVTEMCGRLQNKTESNTITLQRDTLGDCSVLCFCCFWNSKLFEQCFSESHLRMGS